MAFARKLVVWCAALLFGLWLGLYFDRISDPQHGTVRLVLGLFFALCLILRKKPEESKVTVRRLPAPVLAIGAAVLAVAGLITDVHQFEWLGLVVLLYAALRWGLPDRYGRDLLVGMFILYWMHPLPSQVFAPLQLLMQRVSVEGSESVLHAFNVRVWADHFTLHSGMRTFLVPEECSGMKTATTVLMCTLGVTLLLRLKWYEIIPFLFLGLVQVLILNIVRISFMVVWAARMSPEWSSNFLHDTLNVFLLVSVLITQIEASWWKAFRTRRREKKEAIDRGEIEPPEKATILPRFWVLARRWWAVGVAAVLVAGVVVGLAYKNRPYHRVEMVKGAVENLMKKDVAAAQRAIEECLAAYPDDNELLSMKLKALVRRGRFESALQVADSFEGPLGVQETIWKSWALSGVGRMEEASRLVDNLPQRYHDRPAVAIVQAEYSAIKDQPELTARKVATASALSDLVPRVRNLFPYLALREQWSAIVESDRLSVPYRNVIHALVAVKAYRRANDIGSASEALSMALKKWPRDWRFLSSLFDLAMKRPGSKWEEYFASNLRANLADLDTDSLASYTDYSFRLLRPDLGWLAYLELKKRDPDDPDLYLAAARNADKWFLFRKHFLGLEAGEERSAIDLRPMFAATAGIWPWNDLWKKVPLGEEMSSASPGEIRSRYISRCLDELERRERAGELNRRLRLSFPIALAMAGRYSQAHDRLEKLRTLYPEKENEITFQHALFYHGEAEWGKTCEALREYKSKTEMPNLTADLMLINSLMNMNLGAQAMHIAKKGRKRFPGSAEIERAIASIWDVFGHKEQALFVLMRANPEIITRPIVQLLYDTGRYHQADMMSRTLGVNIVRRVTGGEQALFLPPAELTVMRRWPDPLSADEMQSRSRMLRERADDYESPFVRKLFAMKASWLASQGKNDLSDPSLWAGIGRDREEKAGALHHLAGMLARQEMFDEAADAARRASELLPESAVIYRMLISITEGESGIIKEARRNCPEDPYIWLAYLVDVIRQDLNSESAPGAEGAGLQTKSLLSNAVSRAVARRSYSATTMTRAADLLMRNEYNDIAALAARDAVDRARGLVPAYVTGIRVSLRVEDPDWGLLCALQGIEHARNTTPFYKTMVAIKRIRGREDEDLITALQHLRKAQPDETVWTEQLGDAYFEKGDMKRALSVLGPVIREKTRGVRVQSLLRAAEAARLEGKEKYAIDILEAAHALYPDRLSVLNNLIYNMAQSRESVSRAKAMIPTLLEKSDQSAAILDTVAYVYKVSGDLKKAEAYMLQALEKMDKNDPAAAEIRVNAAELALEKGDYDEAVRHLDSLKAESARNDIVNRRMQVLMRRLREKGRPGGAGRGSD